jgi:hypothetical protein
MDRQLAHLLESMFRELDRHLPLAAGEDQPDEPGLAPEHLHLPGG